MFTFNDGASWINHLDPHHQLDVLKLLRETAHRSNQVAAQGAFQQMLQGRTYALLQVRVDGALNAIPEISANKYMLWIRFTTQDREPKPRSMDRDVAFELALCAF